MAKAKRHRRVGVRSCCTEPPPPTDRELIPPLPRRLPTSHLSTRRSDTQQRVIALRIGESRGLIPIPFGDPAPSSAPAQRSPPSTSSTRVQLRSHLCGLLGLGGGDLEIAKRHRSALLLGQSSPSPSARRPPNPPRCEWELDARSPGACAAS